jgi:transposase
MAPIYGYAPKGERLRLRVPRKRGKNTTLLSSMTLGGMGPSVAVEGATTARVFETYVKKVLAPSLEEGQIVLMDNLGAHRPKRVRGLIEQRGCELLYVPSYSPDYNPLEEAFSKIKDLLRKAAARTKEALVEAIGVALSAVTVPKTPGGSSNTPDTDLRLNYRETGCNRRGTMGGACGEPTAVPEANLPDTYLSEKLEGLSGTRPRSCMAFMPSVRRSRSALLSTSRPVSSLTRSRR